MRRTIWTSAAFSAVLLLAGVGTGIAQAEEDPAAGTSVVATTEQAEPSAEPTKDVPAEPTKDAPVEPTENAPASDTESQTPAPTTTKDAPPVDLPTKPADKPVGGDEKNTGTLTVRASLTEGGAVPGVTVDVQPCTPGGDTPRVDLDRSGSATLERPFGCYEVVAILWPEGTRPQDGSTRRVVNLQADNPQTTATLWFTGKPLPPLPPGMFIKKDRVTGAGLGGAVYDLSSCEPDEYGTRRVTTRDDGSVRIAAGTGCQKAVEVQAPDGYQLDTTPVYFNVVRGEHYEVIAYDTPVDYAPVPRDPGRRHALASVPSGPVEEA